MVCCLPTFYLPAATFYLSPAHLLLSCFNTNGLYVGFVFSQTGFTQRLWRKNRVANSNSTCVGTDINRNWNWKWSASGGSSADPCSDVYRGSSPGSTQEFKALSVFQNRLASSLPGVKLYIDWHSYAQLVLTPYGYSSSGIAAESMELSSLAHGYANAARGLYNTTYKAGPVCNTVYKVSGSAIDYSYDVSKIKYSFTTELRDTGKYGFILPANQILPTALESWEGVKYLLDNMR